MFLKKTRDSVSLINGENIPTVKSIFSKIIWKDFLDSNPTFIHGDFHFENLIINKKKIYAIDPRENFLNFKNEGDLYYDLSKFLHGILIDHSLILNNKFSISMLKRKNKDIVSFSLKKPKNLEYKIKDFYNFCQNRKYDLNRIDKLCGMIYLNIACLHHHPYSDLLFYFGKFLLYKASTSKSFIKNNIIYSNIYY